MVSLAAAGTVQHARPPWNECDRLERMSTSPTWRDGGMGTRADATSPPRRTVRMDFGADAGRPAMTQRDGLDVQDAGEKAGMSAAANDAASDAFAQQFSAAAHTMWCIAYSITGNRTLAEDVVQDAAAIALSKLDDFTPGTNFTAWMGRIVRFVALNSMRRAQRDGAGSDAAALDRVPAADTSDGGGGVVTGRGELRADQKSFDDQLAGALATLEETARACLLMRTLLNLPYRDIAAALDIPEGTAMSHVHRARAALREMLADHVQGDRLKGGPAL